MRTAAGFVLCLSLVGMALGCGSGGSGSEESTTVQTPDPGLDGGFVSDFDGGVFTGEIGDAACESKTLEGRREKSAVLFLLDRSGSMNCGPTVTASICDAFPVRPDAGLSKFDEVRTAVTQALTSLRDIDQAGLAAFSSDDACGVSSSPLVPVAELSAGYRDRVLRALGDIKPKGATPLVGGTTVAYAHLNPNQRDPSAAALPHRRFLVLVTDGSETCSPEAVKDFLTTTVRDARSVGIRTFVVGAPGSEGARAMLSEIAFGGGTASSTTCSHGGPTPTVGDCHADLTRAGANFGAELARTLLDASRLAIPCEVELSANLDATRVDFERAVVRITSSSGTTTRVFEDRSALCDGGANGWQYEDGRKRIVLCGAACDAIRNDRGAKVSVDIACRSAAPTTR